LLLFYSYSSSIKSKEGFPKVSGNLSITIAIRNPMTPGKIHESILIYLEKKRI
jgi:hypothetical protein